MDQQHNPGDVTVFTLLKYLFGEWVAEAGYDSEQMEKANAGRFVEWCRANWQTRVTDKWTELERQLGVNSDVYNMATQVIRNDWQIWQILFAWWPMLSLASRPPLKKRPAFMHVSITFGFPDGKGVQLVIPTPNQNHEQFKHDGPLCALLRTQVESVIESVMENGLDKLYEKWAVPMQAPDDTYRKPAEKKLWTP